MGHLIERAQKPLIQRDLERKIVLLSGPRQAGKTTLAKGIFPSSFDYLNYDARSDRIRLRESSWDRALELVVFDEIHKMKDWKRFLKGIYDKEGVRPRILVTGSARMDIARRMGDSLAGRFFQHRLYPLDVKELQGQGKPEEILEALLRLGGFPEPFLSGNESDAARWRNTHLEIILRQDLLTLEGLRDMASVETLVDLLRRRVGSPVSYNSLARDLERDAKTVRRWLTALENLYVVFRVSPHHRNIARSLLKEPKYYFYDVGQVEGDEGARFENLVALSLLKEIHYRQDVEGRDLSLNYLRTKDGREVDFAVVEKGQPTWLIEAKLSASELSPHLEHFGKFSQKAKKLQLVRHLKTEKTFPSGAEMRRAAPWLSKMPL